MIFLPQNDQLEHGLICHVAHFPLRDFRHALVRAVAVNPHWPLMTVPAQRTSAKVTGSQGHAHAITGMMRGSGCRLLAAENLAADAGNAPDQFKVLLG